jgi:hypothetical protein
MAYEIKKIKSGQTPESIATAIRRVMTLGGRFTADIYTPFGKVLFENIRLTYNKDYCGNHPFPCPVRPGGNRPHKRTKCLEGADWVGFNDMINDVLDSLGVVCDAGSSHCKIRKAGERRMNYDGHLLSNNIDAEWDKDTHDYENHIGSAAPVHASFPDGTPGFACYQGQPNYPENHHH